MPNTLSLIEQVRRHVPRHTDYAVAKALEMTQSDLARVLAGKAGLGNKAVVRLSEILQRDLRDVLVLVEEDKARTPKTREFWERRSPRISATIATAILAVFAVIGVSGTPFGYAKGLYAYTGPLTRSIHYAKSAIKWLLTFAKNCFFSHENPSRRNSTLLASRGHVGS